MKRIISFVLILVMLVGQFTYAETSEFIDLDKDHWAYEAVLEMSQRGILSGYDDGSFKPNKAISRAEFATVMVLALDLQPNFDAKSSFIDMDDDHWVVPYVDAAKSYLTGYSSNGGMKFKPDEDALREDMAVAIVRARGYEVSSADLSYLEDYKDADAIDENLKPYVGAAIKNGIMVGSYDGDSKVFNPNDVLTRAQAAALLLNIVEEEEKIVLDDSEVTLNIDSKDDGLNLTWDVSQESGLKGFKIVASKYNNSPVYPQDGYVKYISNTGTRSHFLSGKIKNNNGDFDYLEGGEKYYFSVTALYEDEKIPSPSVHIEYPDVACEDVDINLKGYEKNGYVVLDWDVDTCEHISGYKIVASKSDSSPVYPDNGYYKYVSNDYRHVEIGEGAYYNGGDFERFEAGQTYYFSLTALVGDGKAYSNTVALTFAEREEPVVELKGIEKGNQIVLEWSDYNDQDITGFKVVASRSDGSPVYPEDGYFKYVPKGANQRVEINVNDYYNGGDIGMFEAGQTYYFSITALVGDQKYPSNTLALSFDQAVEPEVYLEGIVDDNQVVLEWSDSNDAHITGFKVVASKSDGSPIYPEDGYFRYIQKGQDQRVVINLHDQYYEGDFYQFEAGETYHFSITALVGDYKYPSNTVTLTFEEALPPQVELEGYADGPYVYLNWTSFNDHHVEGFKVVASKSNASPIYPDSGYYKYIGIGQAEEAKIEVGSYYNNGDFEQFMAGETYYFSITTIYDGGKIASNTLPITFND